MELTVGMLVTHPKCPDWGTGKVLMVDSENAWVYFLNAREAVAGQAVKKLKRSVVQLDLAPSQSDPWLDRLPNMVRNGKIHPLPRPRLTFVQAVEVFMTCYPAGFADSKYLEEERDYKIAAHEELVRMGMAAGDRRASQLAPGEFVEALRKGLKGLNLLALYENLAFRDGLSADTLAAAAYRDAVVEVCARRTPDRASFDALIAAVGALPAEAHRVDSWPVLTIVPFIARPDIHMLLKPQMTKLAAERLAFDVLYTSDLNWSTYERLLEMGRILFERLVPHGARDFIDVQSFMWVTAGVDAG